MMREHLKGQPVTEMAATQEVLMQEVLHSSQVGLRMAQKEQAPQATTWSTSIEKKKEESGEKENRRQKWTRRKMSNEGGKARAPHDAVTPKGGGGMMGGKGERDGEKGAGQGRR